MFEAEKYAKIDEKNRTNICGQPLLMLDVSGRWFLNPFELVGLDVDCWVGRGGFVSDLRANKNPLKGKFIKLGSSR